MRDALNNVTLIDTSAINILLSNSETLKKADPTSLANASIASILQVVAEVGIDNFINANANANVNFKEDSSGIIVNKVLSNSAPEKQKETLTVSVNTAKILLYPTDANANTTGIVRDDINPDDIKILSEIIDVIGTVDVPIDYDVNTEGDAPILSNAEAVNGVIFKSADNSWQSKILLIMFKNLSYIYG